MSLSRNALESPLSWVWHQESWRWGSGDARKALMKKKDADVQGQILEVPWAAWSWEAVNGRQPALPWGVGIRLGALREEGPNACRYGTQSRQKRPDVLPVWNWDIASEASQLPGNTVQGLATSCLSLRGLETLCLGWISDTGCALTTFPNSHLLKLTRSLLLMCGGRESILCPSYNWKASISFIHSFIHSFQHVFVGDFMPDTVDKGVNNLFSMHVQPLAPPIPSWADLYLPSPYLPPTSWIKGTENFPMDFRSNLFLAFQQLPKLLPFPHHFLPATLACKTGPTSL